MTEIAPQVRAFRNGDAVELDMLGHANNELNEVYVAEIKTQLRQEQPRGARARRDEGGLNALAGGGEPAPASVSSPGRAGPARGLLGTAGCARWRR